VEGRRTSASTLNAGSPQVINMNKQKVKKLTKAEQKEMFRRLSRGSEWVNPLYDVMVEIVKRREKNEVS